MCGRFTLRTPGDVVADHFSLPRVPALEPRYNAAPGQALGGVRAREGPEAPAGEREWVALRWGLVPGWAEDPRIGARLVNARAESAAERPAFRDAWRRRRCAIPADGFYEWRGRGRRRQPYLVEVGGGALFGLAGLWERWQGPDGARIESCCVLTTEAGPRMREIHDRMPFLLLDREALALWLAPDAPETALRPLLAPLADARLRLRPVGERVNRVEHDDPACLAPPAPPAQGTLGL